MELITSNDILREYFPNVLLEVDDELALYDKIKGYLRSAEQWLSANILGSAYVLEGSALNIARRITVDRALAQAIPSLDLVLTPNGLGIVSTESLAPASKERVERLIGSLESSASAHLEILLDMLREDAKWRSSRQGSIFAAHWSIRFRKFLAGVVNLTCSRRLLEFATSLCSLRLNFVMPISATLLLIL